MTFLDNLSKNLSSLLDEGYDHNVLISVGKNPNIKEFKAHSNILKARSPYFNRALSENWAHKKNDKILFNKPNIDPTIFSLILK